MTTASCPDDLTLAAYLETRLSPQARQGVLAHLADCDHCSEVVAEATRFLEPQSVRQVVSLEEHRNSSAGRSPRSLTPSGKRFAWAAAAALLAALGAIYLRPPSPPLANEPGMSATLAAEIARAFPGGLAERVWRSQGGPSGMAFSDTASAATLAFRWGVATVDLETASARDDAAAIARVIAEVDAWPVAPDRGQRRMLSHLGSPDSDDKTRGIAELRALESRFEETGEADAFALGRWAEAGRLAAVAGDEELLRTSGFLAARPAAAHNAAVERALAEIDVLMPAGTAPWDLPTLAMRLRDLILLH